MCAKSLWRKCARGVLITQGGRVVDAGQPLRGAIRLRRPLADD